MEALYSFLCEHLKGATKLAILGAGSVLKADDKAGVDIVQNLKTVFPKHPNVLLCIGETAPENYSGKICSFAPSHVLVLDAADVGAEPGEVVLIDPEKVGGPTFCSHMLPIRVMLRYIADETNAHISLLGIQYKSIAFDGPMTEPIAQSVQKLSDALIKFIKTHM